MRGTQLFMYFITLYYYIQDGLCGIQLRYAARYFQWKTAADHIPAAVMS